MSLLPRLAVKAVKMSSIIMFSALTFLIFITSILLLPAAVSLAPLTLLLKFISPISARFIRRSSALQTEHALTTFSPMCLLAIFTAIAQAAKPYASDVKFSSLTWSSYV